MEKSANWYSRYDELRREVEELRTEFYAVCQATGVDPNAILNSMATELVAKIVHESNLQEDIQVNPHRTRELADAVFNDLSDTSVPRLDIESILSKHRELILRFKKKGATDEEISALNLARATYVIGWMHEDITMRRMARELAIFSLVGLPRTVNLIGDFFVFPDDNKQSQYEAASTQKVPNDLFVSEDRTIRGIIDQYCRLRWKGLDPDGTETPVPLRYIHFLHRLILMGIVDSRKCGRFRSTPVNVGNPDLIFPPREMVPSLMARFCDSVHPVRESFKEFDPILKAADVSYRFVSIHPYADGNGRISRILMNLMLWGEHPMIYLKADKTGRRRYIYALRRADRNGDITGLAALIAMSLKKRYESFVLAIKRHL